MSLSLLSHGDGKLSRVSPVGTGLAEEISLRLKASSSHQVDRAGAHRRPMGFDRLVARIVVDKALLESIESLLQTKKAGKEVDRGPKIPAVSNFIEAELARFDSHSVAAGPKPNVDKLNELFRYALGNAW